MGGKNDNKASYFDKLKGLLEEYRSIFIVSVDNVCEPPIYRVALMLMGLSENRSLLSRCMRSVSP